MWVMSLQSYASAIRSLGECVLEQLNSLIHKGFALYGLKFPVNTAVLFHYLGLDATEPVFRVSKKVMPKSACSATKTT